MSVYLDPRTRTALTVATCRKCQHRPQHLLLGILLELPEDWVLTLTGPNKNRTFSTSQSPIIGK